MVGRLMNNMRVKSRLGGILRRGVLAAVLVGVLPGAGRAAGKPEPYLRVVRPNADEVELQVVARQFKRPQGDGPVIWLTGVTHVGDVAYYHALQKHLDEQSIVLFEGVGGGPETPPRKKEDAVGRQEKEGDAKGDGAEGDDAAEDNELHSVQGTLADSLGLVFQLDTIDYTRPHFENSDLSIPQIRWLLSGGKEEDMPQRSKPARRKALEGRGSKPTKPAVAPPAKPSAREPERGEAKPDKEAEPKAESAAGERKTESGSEGNADSAQKDADKPSQSAEQFDRLLQVMDGSSAMGAMVDSLLKFIGTSPKLKAITRLMFIEVLGGLKGDLANTAAIPPELREVIEVLIRSRNKQVILDLQAQLAKETPPASISVFYGAGHMDDLQRRMVDELGYEPVKDEWFTAFDVNTREAGINLAEKALVNYIIKIQMQVLNTPAAGTQNGTGRKEAQKAQED